MKIKEIIGEDFSSVSDLENFQKYLGKAFGGVAKTWHLPFGPTPQHYDYGWTILSFLPKHKDKILKIITNISKSSDHYLYTYDPSENKVINYSGTMYDHRLLDTMLNEPSLKYKKWKEQNPNNIVLCLFYGRKEVEHDDRSSNIYYHASNASNLDEIGISPQSTLKYKNRVYFWGKLENAEVFANWLTYNETTKRKAYIYEVKYNGKIFKDFEFSGFGKDDAFYCKEFIPPKDVKKIKTFHEMKRRDTLY